MDSASVFKTPTKPEGKKGDAFPKEPTYAEILKSPIQTFCVGPERTAINLHSVLAYHFSPKLKVQVKPDEDGPFTLDDDGTPNFIVNLRDVNPDTFIRFGEWMHRGDYMAAPTIRTAKANDPDITTPERPRAGAACNGKRGHSVVGDGLSANSPLVISEQSETGRKRRRFDAEPSATQTVTQEALRNSRLWKDFENFDPQLGKFPRRIFVRVKNFAANTNPWSDYTNHFLSHAELCVFAIEWEVPALFIFALEKLHRSLISFMVHRERVGDIIKLVDYVYQKTESKGQGGCLRSMVSRYMLARSKDFLLTEEYMGLLDRGGDLVKDLLKDLFQIFHQGKDEA
ncbi:MAG: hypothetical protein M1829_003961 [Trizodia sp. TS-e1964]|nr:MAG: hypothetical protein M1829_003961 [Trizodia sp. TS-e1964]